MICYKPGWDEPRIASESWHSGQKYAATMFMGEDAGISLSKWIPSDERSEPGAKLAAKLKVMASWEAFKS